MKKNLILLLLIIGVSFASSCQKDIIKNTQVTPTLQLDAAFDQKVTITEGNFTFKNVSTGEEKALAFDSTNIILPEGIYNITFVGKGFYVLPVTEFKNEVNIQAVAENINVIDESASITLKPVITEANKEGDFVIAEIAIAGTAKPDGKQYNGDQYFKIHNNSNKVLYADGLIIIESSFSTALKQEIVPNIIQEAFAIQYMMKIPGSGKDFPIEPGESFILADNAMNHKEANINSYDLSGALAEWHSELNPISVDNPDVPNAENVYLNAGKFWMANKQGNKAYVIGRYPEGVNNESFLKDYVYDYIWKLATPSGSMDVKKSTMKFPNEWIIDGVNLSPKTSFKWRLTGDKIDLGWSSIGETSSPAENAGKAVIRKKDEAKTTSNGFTTLVDSNNSTEDFVSTQASLIGE